MNGDYRSCHVMSASPNASDEKGYSKEVRIRPPREVAGIAKTKYVVFFIRCITVIALTVLRQS